MNPISLAGIALIRAYQLCVSPWLGAHCRFTPSCSAYSIQALQTHGPVKGSWLAASRICRCHPFAESRYDPVPTKHCQKQEHLC
jgi:putative membrane protein insertion efficiency factor